MGSCLGCLAALACGFQNEATQSVCAGPENKATNGQERRGLSSLRRTTNLGEVTNRLAYSV